MSNKVFANGREIACKASDGESICSFPNVCFTPPQTPATPLGAPLPYPNTGVDKDLAKGSKHVQMHKQKVFLHGQSCIKKSTGSEAGKAPKKGILTTQNKGKLFAASWSTNVEIEGKKVVRHLDLMTHNHGSTPPNTVTWLHRSSAALAALKLHGACSAEIERAKRCFDKAGNARCPSTKRVPTGSAKNPASRGAFENYATRVQKNKCGAALRCLLVSYQDGKSKGKRGCCPPQTPHHLIPKASFKGLRFKQPYNGKAAPCICADGEKTVATHGLLHEAHAKELKALAPSGGKITFGQALDIAVKNVKDVFPDSGCSDDCIRAQLKAGHPKIDESDMIHAKSQEPKTTASLVQDFQNRWKNRFG